MPAPSWQCDAVPHAYEEAGKVQFLAMPGINWIRDSTSPNGRGYYRGPEEAIRIVATLLESAGVCKILQQPARGDRRAALDWGSDWPARFRDYQRDGAAWCASMLGREGAALLADDMGIGKTPQAIAALDALLPQSSARLVVCPAIVRSHWAAKVKEWSTTDPALWHAYSYEGFQSAARKGQLPSGIGGLALDEVHYCSNPKAKRTAAIAAWTVANPAVPRLGLSGTPMTARPRDLWSPLDILWPGRFGKAFNFQKRYCDGKWEPIPNCPDRPPVWNSEGVSRSEELHCRLQACMLRRTKSDVALELPPRTRVTVEVELPRAAMRDLQRAAAAIAGAQGQWRGGVSTLLSNVESYKIDAACALARDIVAAGSRALILTTRRETARLIGRELQAPVASGDVEADDRQEMLRDASIGVSTIYAVTTGIDLVGYDHIIFTGLDWVPSVLLQAEARIHRIGQDKPCVIHYLIGLHTIDEVVRERVIERLDSFAAIVGNDDSALRGDLAGGNEDDLIAGIVARVREMAA